MKKIKVIVFVSVVLALALISVPDAWASGLAATITIPYPEGTGWDASAQNKADPYATPTDACPQVTFDVWDDLTLAPDPPEGKDLFGYGHLNCGPAVVCFPVTSGEFSTKIYYYSPIYGWVMPGLPTSTTTVGAIKYRCADAPAPGYYGLLGVGLP